MRVGIYGSCITRDAVEFWPPGWRLAGYVGLHSLASLPAPSEPTPQDWAPAGWRRRMLLADITSTTLPTLMSLRPEAIIWDVVSERHGVQSRHDAGLSLGGEISYSTRVFRQFWLEGLAEFDVLRQEVPVVLNAVEWDPDDERSASFARFQDWAADRALSIGFRVARTANTRSDTSHKWGQAPFHLRREDYIRSVENLMREIG